MPEHKLGTPHMPLSAEFDKLHACHAHSGQEVCLRLCARHNCACRLRESSCSRLLSGDTVVQAAARAVAGPYQLGWVPCGSRHGRTRPAGPALCVLNIHVSPTRTTSQLCEWFGHLRDVRVKSFRCSPSPAQRRHHPRRLRRRRGMPPPNRHGAEPSVHACNAYRRRVDRIDRQPSPPRCAVDVVEKSLERGASMLHGATDVSDTSRLLMAALSDIH